MTIYVDTGHGMSNRRPGVYDPGAVSAYGKEAEIVRAVAAKLLPLLSARGFDARMAPDGSIDSRGDWQAKTLVKGDVFLSLHMNSGSFSGSSVFYAATKPYLHDEASALSAEVARVLGLKDEGGKPDTAAAVKSIRVLRSNPDANQFLFELARIGHEAGVKAVLERGAEAVAYAIQKLVAPPQPALSPEEAAAWAEMRALGVYSEYTKPGTPVDTTKLAVFLSRFRKAA